MKKLIFFSVIILVIGASILPINAQNKKPKITFIELGSTNCIPCKKMQPIMKSLEKKYGEQLKVVFHDVNKDKDKVKQFNIKLIPTQIFQDENGKELLRHEGFYPEKEIDKFLQGRGLSFKK